MIEIVVTELNRSDSKHNRYIRFDLDDGKDFCYRSRVSHGAFFRNYKRMRNHTSKFLYISKRMYEFQFDLNAWAYMMNKYPDLPDIHGSVPVVTVKNLWGFYKLIGYDYKTKKWI